METEKQVLIQLSISQLELLNKAMLVCENYGGFYKGEIRKVDKLQGRIEKIISKNKEREVVN